nr:hypothetical protein [uncultured Cohaesibacter sp.]
MVPKIYYTMVIVTTCPSQEGMSVSGSFAGCFGKSGKPNHYREEEDKNWFPRLSAHHKAGIKKLAAHHFLQSAAVCMARCQSPFACYRVAPNKRSTDAGT